jgi:ADP-L-glycero-D-manno-heptose 6-epimerase
MPEQLRKQYQYFTEADTRKLQTTRIYKPFSTLEDSIVDYVQEFLMKDEAHW